MKKTILLMDNDEDFLEVHARLLTQADYEVLKASSIAAAAAILADRFLHLAILDVRMEDDTDPQDISGLKLAEEKAYQSVPKIILTAYPSWNYAEKALGAALEGLQITGMVAKADGPDALLQAIEQAFTKHILINERLLIHWSEREALNFPYLITLLEPQIEAENLPLRISELETLFHRLFHKSHQITISRLFKRGEGTLFLGLFTYTGDRKTNQTGQYVVTCGLKEAVKKELKYYEELVPQATVPGSLVKERMAETTRFAAIAYPLTGGELAEITSFTDFYQYNTAETVISALNHLFEITLHSWYGKGRLREEQETSDTFLRTCLGLVYLTQAELEQRIQNVCQDVLRTNLVEIVLLPHQLQWRAAPEFIETCVNPIPFLYKKHPAFAPPFLSGTTHGRLSSNSILVGPEAQTWLIDFGQVAQGPLVRDFVALETAIKLDLMMAGDVAAIYEAEKRLLAVSRLDETIDSANLEPAIQKAIQIISRIRYHAVNIIGPEIGHYLGGLFFYAMARLATYDPGMPHTRRELLPHLHALLSAALICEQLAPSSREDLPPQAVRSLWIDDNGTVWVENRKVDLTPREFELLNYLYQYEGRVCDRIDIAQAVFNETFADIEQLKLNSQETKERLKRDKADPVINSTMNRLRKKVEVNPRHEYIVTERGKGYRLDLGNYAGD